MSFALPIVEKLKEEKFRGAAGASPIVLVVSPTRELAKQITTEFEVRSFIRLFVC